MAKKIFATTNSPLTIYLTEPYRLYSKFTEKVLLPIEAIDSRYRKVIPQTETDWKAFSNAKFVTNDKKFVKVKFLSAYNNGDGSYNEELDRLCMNMYGIPLSTVKSVWYARIGDISNFWQLIEMVEYGKN